MGQKNATPTKEQKAVLKKHKLPEYLWVVMKEFPYSMMVRHRVTGEIKVIDK